MPHVHSPPAILQGFHSIMTEKVTERSAPLSTTMDTAPEGFPPRSIAMDTGTEQVLPHSTVMDTNTKRFPPHSIAKDKGTKHSATRSTTMESFLSITALTGTLFYNF